MTLPVNPNRVYLSGNGTVTAFAFPYRFFDEEDLKVLVRDSAGNNSTQSLNSDYSVTGEGEDSGGTVTFINAPNASTTVIIYRDPELSQELDLQDLSTFPAEEVEREFDRQCSMLQRMDERLDRATLLSDTDVSPVDLVWPDASQRASKYVAFDASGRFIMSSGTAGATVPVSTFMETVLDDTNAASAQATLGLSALARSLADDTDSSQHLGTLGFSTLAKNLRDDTDTTQFLTTLGGASALRAALALDQTSRIVGHTLAGTNANSVGSGSNKVFRWADLSQTGSDWTISTDSTLGSVFTNLVGGLYAFELVTLDSTATRSFGYTLDATGTDLTTGIFSLSSAKRICATSSPVNLRSAIASVRRIAANQVIRAQTQEGSIDQTTCFMQITKIGN